MERAKRFYKNLFGLEVVLDQDGNVILTEGLVLQDAEIWRGFLKREIAPRNHATDLYFGYRKICDKAGKLSRTNRICEPPYETFVGAEGGSIL